MIYEEIQGLGIEESAEELGTYFFNLVNKYESSFKELFKPIEVETEKTKQIEWGSILYTNLNSFILKVVKGESEANLFSELKTLRDKVEAYKKNQEEKPSSPDKVIEMQSEVTSKVISTVAPVSNIEDSMSQVIAGIEETDDFGMGLIFGESASPAAKESTSPDTDIRKVVNDESELDVLIDFIRLKNKEEAYKKNQEEKPSSPDKVIETQSEVTSEVIPTFAPVSNIEDYMPQVIAGIEETDDFGMGLIFGESASPAAKESTSPDTDIRKVVNDESEVDVFIEFEGLKNKEKACEKNQEEKPSSPDKVIEMQSEAASNMITTFAPEEYNAEALAAMKEPEHLNFFDADGNILDIYRNPIYDSPNYDNANEDDFFKSNEEGVNLDDGYKESTSPDTGEASVNHSPLIMDDDADDDELMLNKLEESASTEVASLQQNSDKVQVICIDDRKFDKKKKKELLGKFNKIIEDSIGKGMILTQLGKMIKRPTAAHFIFIPKIISFTKELEKQNIRLIGSSFPPSKVEYISAFMKLSRKDNEYRTLREKSLSLFKKLEKGDLPFLNSNFFNKEWKNKIVGDFNEIKNRIIGESGSSRKAIEVETMAKDQEMISFLDGLKDKGIFVDSVDVGRIGYVKVLSKIKSEKKRDITEREVEELPPLNSHAFDKIRKKKILDEFIRVKDTILKEKSRKVIAVEILADDPRMSFFINGLEVERIFMNPVASSYHDYLIGLNKMTYAYISKSQKSESKVEEVSTEVSESEQGPEGDNHFAEFQTKFQEEAQVEKSSSQDEGQSSFSNEDSIQGNDDEESIREVEELPPLNSRAFDKIRKKKYWTSLFELRTRL